METGGISKLTLQRLPTYLSYLRTLPQEEGAAISAAAIASALGLGEVQVRKDLATVSDAGKPKVGYLIADLISMTQECRLRLIAPIAIISSPLFTRCATPDQKRPMPYVSLPALEINDGSMAMAMSSSPRLSLARRSLIPSQSTEVLKFEEKVLAVRPP